MEKKNGHQDFERCCVEERAVHSKEKTKELVFQRSILGRNVAHSDKYKLGISLEKALAFPLPFVAISLGTADSPIKKTLNSNIY